jgi:AcrR family transcriptional regulator
MVRTASETRPDELLDAVADYLAKHGAAGLSLRPLAKAVGSSPRVLLYYFGSKEEMLSKALARSRERQRGAFAEILGGKFATPSEACRAIWRTMTDPRLERQYRLFFETYAAALRQPKKFRGFLRSAVEEWLAFLAAPLLERGAGEQAARAYATVVLAGFRGFLLDYCATRDRQRIDRAFDLWLRAVDVLTPHAAASSSTVFGPRRIG